VVQSALLGGLFIGVLSALPIINIANCCCLWVTSGGALAAYLERQNDPRGISVGRGALAGLTAGVIGALVWLVASLALDVVIAPLQRRMLDEVLRGARDMPPEARAWLEAVGSQASTALRWIVGFLFQLTLGMVFATAGGALAGLFFSRNVPPALGGGQPGTAIPPPLPPQ
jgi:hypothetical protein